VSAVAAGARESVAGPGGRRANESQFRALVGLGLVVVLLVAAVSGLWWLEHRDRQTEVARNAALPAAPAAAVTLLSYDYRSVDQDLRRARAMLTGGYRDEFAVEAGQVTAPAARAQHITTHATVIGSAVVRADPDEVVVLLFVNQSTRSSRSPAVQLSAHRIQLTMALVGGHWLVSKLERV
jgi:Mce-associated membrane protein